MSNPATRHLRVLVGCKDDHLEALMAHGDLALETLEIDLLARTPAWERVWPRLLAGERLPRLRNLQLRGSHRSEVDQLFASPLARQLEDFAPLPGQR